MIQFLRQQCCCGGPCPCAVSDDFAVDSIADYDVTGTFAVAGGVLTASTAGTATQTLKLPTGTRAAGVKADVIDNSHALFGLVIGSGDNRIEWLWDVANTQCTLVVYSEGAAIVDEDYAGAPATSLEVQITANDCSWDVAVYRDGTLLDTHTAVAVTFDADWTAFGVTANDASGGTWDNLCLRSCTVCNITPACETNVQPMAWSLTAAGIGDAGGTFDAFDGWSEDYTDCVAACGMLNGEWTLVRYDYARHVSSPLGETCQTPSWVEMCVWVSAIPGVDSPTRAGDCDGAVDDRWFAIGLQCWGEFGGSKSVTHDLFDNECSWEGTVFGAGNPECTSGVAWSIEEEYRSGGTEVRIVATGAYDIRTPLPLDSSRRVSGTYVSAWETVPFDFVAAGPITLDFDSSSATDVAEAGCDWPLTVEIEPADTATQNQIAGCWNLPRCVNLFSTHGLLSLDGSIGGVTGEFRVCLSGPAGYSNGPFTGTITGATQGMTGDCAAATINVTLECKRVCEHQYAWVLVLDDGTNVAEIVYEPAAAPNVGDVVSGTVTLCGGSQVFAALLSDFAGVEEDHPLALACPDADPGLFCESQDSLRVRGQSDGSLCVPASCTSTMETLELTQGEILCGGTPITSTGFDDEKPYFRGPLPVNDGFGTFTGFQIVLFFNGSALQALMLDSTNCIVDAGVVSIDCESLTGTIDFTNLNTACCASGSFRVHFG